MNRARRYTCIDEWRDSATGAIADKCRIWINEIEFGVRSRKSCSPLLTMSSLLNLRQVLGDPIDNLFALSSSSLYTILHRFF